MRAGSMPPMTSTTTSTSPGDQRVGVGGEQRRVDRHGRRGRARAADGDADELERRADPGGEVVGVRRRAAGRPRCRRRRSPAARPSAACAPTARRVHRRGLVDPAGAGPSSRLLTRRRGASRSSSVSRRTITRGRAVAHRDHRRARARGCSCWPWSGSRRRWPGTASRSPGATSAGQARVLDHDVAALAVLADHAGQHGSARRSARRPACTVYSAS